MGQTKLEPNPIEVVQSSGQALDVCVWYIIRPQLPSDVVKHEWMRRVNPAIYISGDGGNPG